MELRRQFRVRGIRTLTAAAPILAALFGVLALTAPAPTSAVQTIPYLINFQGRLTDNNGNVLSDGSYNVKFRLFDAASAGTNLWEGDRIYGASDHRITVQNGLFNIQFGDTTQGDPALSPSLFNNQTHPQLYLEVELPTPGTATCASNGCASWTEGAMTPRQPLASATYAFNSDTLDGLDSSNFVQLTPSGQQIGSVNVSGNITTGAALQAASAVFTNGSNSNIVTLQAGNTSGNYALTLPTSQAIGIKVLENDGSGNLSWASPGACADCVLNDSGITATTNTIAPVTDVSALTIRQTTAASPTKNIFAITDSTGATNFFSVDQTGQVAVGQASASEGKITFYNGTNATTASIYNDGNLHVDSGSNNVWIDSSSLYLDANSHSNVGINTSSPGDTLTVNGNIQVRDADAATKGFRLRTNGPAVDLESGGAQLYLSTWSAASFSGTQYVQFIFDNAGGDIAAQRSMFFANGANRSLYVQQAASGNNGNGLTIQGGAGNGTDQTGGNLVLAGGTGTGAGVGGNIDFQVAKPSSTGTGSNSLATALSISGTDGSATFSNAVSLIGVPASSTTSQLLGLGPNNIANGSTDGTYIGANPASFSGDFANFQVNGTSRFELSGLGDETAGFTQLDGSSTTNGTGTNSTSMVLTSVTNFDVGNYIRLQNGTACDGAATTCYAKITAVNTGTNTLTITPALTWASGKTVDEWHVPEIGGSDTAQTLTTRYGRGYFIAGVATGNGTTYYSEDSINSSLTTFNLLTSNITTLNIGSSSTNVSLPGSLTVGGQSVVNSSGQVNGAQLQANSVPNTALANSSITINSTGISGGGTVALGGSLSLATVYGSTTNTAVQGSVTLVCPSGSGNVSGTGNTITLGSGGTCNSLSLVNNPTFSGQLTLSGNGTTGTPIFFLSGAPTNDAASSLVQLAGAISGGNNATNGGTYLGLNLPSSGAGSAADFLNFQKAGTVELKVDNSGNVTAGGTFTGNGSGLTNLNPTNLVQGSGAVTLQSASATTLTIDSGTTGDINIGTSANAKTIQIGNSTSTSVTDIEGGSSGNVINPSIAIGNSGSNHTIEIGTNSLATDTIYLGSPGGASATTISAGTGGITIGDDGSAKQINIGSVANTAGDTVNIGTNSSSINTINIGSTNATSTTNIEGGGSGTVFSPSIAIGNNATSHVIAVGTNSLAINQVYVGSLNGTSSTTIQGGSGNITLNTAAGHNIVIGSSTTDTNQILLQLDSFSTFADTGTCATTTNQGALYYNTGSNTVRSCVNGNWEDVVTTSGLGLLLFGVVPDSGSGAGDLGSITSAAVNGPCKVSWATSTTVKIVQGCTAYSGGRKVIIPDNTTPTGTLTTTNNNFQHICLTGANDQPAFSASGSESADMPTFSINNPVLCLADIKTSSNAISAIYDVRTFTTTSKTFATLNATTGILGGIVSQTTTAGVVQLASATTQLIRGVVVATAGSSATNNTINMIIANRGPQYVKATGTAQSAGTGVLETTTAGYSGSGTASTTAFATLGLSLLATTGTCSAAATCIDSQFTDINIR